MDLGKDNGPLQPPMIIGGLFRVRDNPPIVINALSILAPMRSQFLRQGG